MVQENGLENLPAIASPTKAKKNPTSKAKDSGSLKRKQNEPHEKRAKVKLEAANEQDVCRKLWD
jgi:hypothetical protein